MTPREMAAAVAAIMTVVPSASPSAIVDRLCITLGSVVPAPQWETMNFSVQFAVVLHRELCEFLFRDNNTVMAFLTFTIKTLTMWHRRPSLRDN